MHGLANVYHKVFTVYSGLSVNKNCHNHHFIFWKNYGNLLHNCFIFISNMPHNGFIYEAQMDMIENSGHCLLYVEKFSYFGHHQVPLYHTYVGLDPNTYHPPVPCRVKNALIYPLSSNLKASQCYIKEVWIVTRMPTYHNYFI